MKQLSYSDFRTIRYMGSKKRLMDFISLSFSRYGAEFIEFNIKSFFDVFCGSGSVAFYFRHQYQIITNDKLAFSKVIMDAYLRNERNPKFYRPYIDELNHITIDDFDTWLEHGKIDGWISQNYGGECNHDNSNINAQGARKIWLLSNAKKIEMILAKIEAYSLSEIEKNVLLLSLFLAIDKISNSLGHQNGYLKEWSENAQEAINLDYPNIEQWKDSKHLTICSNILETQPPYADIMYIDPPYGTNNTNVSVSTRYASFYHLWDTLVTSKPFQRPEIFGKAGKPTKNRGFSEALEINKKEIVIPELIKIITNSNSKYVAMSYSNKGLLNIADIEYLFQSSNCDMSSFRIFTSKHKNNIQTHTATKSGKFINRRNHEADLIEYLFIAKKSDLSFAMIPQRVLREGNKMNRYVGYYRVSTKRQEQSGLGLEAQQMSISSYVDLKSGILLADFNEIESGKVNNRPKLYEAIEACRLYDATLLIAKLDRLSRDAAFLLTLQKGDVPFIAVDMPDANNMTIGIMALLAQQEREMISKRTKEALAILKSKGKRLGGRREKTHIFTEEDIEKGKNTKEKRFEIYKNRVLPIIRELRDNQLSYREICEALEDKQIKTFRKKTIWTIGSVRNILK